VSVRVEGVRIMQKMSREQEDKRERERRGRHNKYRKKHLVNIVTELKNNN